jgi:alpha-N-arabinofuranosidase
MKQQIISAAIAFAFALPACAQDAKVTIHVNEGTQKIHKEIYGQFAEHLGTCIYGGLWVGPNSSIPNTNGYRNDVLQALKDLKVPVLRWPGGCFADEYHWRDGIGPRENRPSLKNNNWGGTIEDNSFGTHEFLNLCEMLGCEPYISGNVGSGTVEELAKWVEYMTSEEGTPMAKLRKENGREKPWKVKYLGVGNESWGCGGNMRPEYYADLYRRYSIYCRNYDNNKLYKIASGASDYDYNWTKVLMDNVGDRMDGVSLHYYTCSGWDGSKGSATNFNNDEYYWTLGKCLEIEDVVKKHCDIMDEKDPQKKIGLLVDEWGTWWDEEPGTISGHLYQQNAMRDALVAALSLNVFHRHCDRVRMANIAQIVNVLQSMILTDTKGTGHMVLTPTYHVFNMYKPFQEATYLPLDLKCDEMRVRHEMRKEMDVNKKDGFRRLPLVSASAAKTADGSIVISLTNVALNKAQEIEVDLEGVNAKSVTGQILTSKSEKDFNDFENPNRVQPVAFKDAKLKKGAITVNLPAKSIVILNVK